MYRMRLWTCCLIAAVLSHIPAQATLKSWNNASGGSWYSQSSWTPSGWPASTDTAIITLSGTYTVTIDASNAEVSRLILGGSSGIQTLRIVAPAQQLNLEHTSEIGVHGRLEIGRNTLLISMEAGEDTLTNSGTIVLDSSGMISMGWDCYLLNQAGGSIQFTGPGSVMAYHIEAFGGRVENAGSIAKNGAGELTLFCAYDQTSNGTLSLESGSMKVWAFAADGPVTLATGTETIVGDAGEPPPGSAVEIGPNGTMDLQGAANISGGGGIKNAGLLKHTAAGASIISISYTSVELFGGLRVLAGKLSLTNSSNRFEGMVVISSLAELEITDGSFIASSSVVSEAADSGSLVLTGSNSTDVYCSFPFSGALRIHGVDVNFNPSTDPVTVRSFTMDAGADFSSTVDIQADSVNMNGGSTDANIIVGDQCSWTAGEFVGSGGTTITLNSGTSLDIHGPALKVLDTRDLIVGGSASMSGSGSFAMTGGASIIVDPTGSLAIGDSISITGAGDSLINHGQLTFNCPYDTALVSAFLYNIPSSRTPGVIEILSGKVVCESSKNFGTVEMAGGTELIVTTLWDNAGSMTVNSGAKWTISGALQNEALGIVHLFGAAEIGGSGSVSNAGLIDYTGGTRSVTSTVIDLEFDNLGVTGRLEVISDTLTLTSGGSNAGDIYIHSGAVLRILGTFANEASGTIRGGGTLDICGASFANNGTISPGSSPGTLSILGGLNTQGTINIEAAGASQGIQYDHLWINGGVTLGGNLHLSLLNGYIPTLTDTFRILDYTSRSGEFTAVTGTPVGNGTFMEIAYRPAEIVQFVCNGISDINTSVPSIADSIHFHKVDTIGLIISNQGHCPLEWTTEFTAFSPGYPDSCPTWGGVESGGSGLLTRGQSVQLRVAVSTWCPPGTYTSQIRIAGNDPDEPLIVIPVEIVVPSVFNIGRPQPDFSEISEAIGYLVEEGINEPTLFSVFPNTNYGPATIPSISGASAVNTITFRCDAGVAKIRCNNAPALILDGADHVVFDRINFENYGTGGTYPYAVWITGNADSNAIRNACVTGPSLLPTSSCIGIFVDGDGCDGNLLEGDTIVHSYRAVRLGSAAASCKGNEVRQSYITECTYGIYLYYQSAKIHDNDIQPGYVNPILAVAGIHAFSQRISDTLWIYNNRIHNFRGGFGGTGVLVESSTIGAIHVFNNFIYDWQISSGTVFGIYVNAPKSIYCSFNSIRINDAAANSLVCAIYLSNASAQMVLLNNILEVEQAARSCWSICHMSGNLSSDNNCFYGTGSQYNVGCVGSTDYASLSDWRTGTGQDFQSRQGNPGFLSATDLHIDPFTYMIDSAGVSVPGIVTDIDGNPRAGVPDIGADEYIANHARVDDLVICPDIATNSVILRWGSLTGASCYRIYRTDPTTSSIDPSIFVASVAETTYTHAGILSSAMRLYYHVTASSTCP